MSTPALTDRPVSKTQIFCSNLPWSVNGKILRTAFEARGHPVSLAPPSGLRRPTNGPL